MTDPTDPADRVGPTSRIDPVRRFLWPASLVGGLLLVAFGLAPWGVSDQGVRPKVSGVGRVSVPGAAPEDVAFLENHTQRPALVVIILAAVIAIAAVVGWWRQSAFWPAIVVVASGSAAVTVWTAIVLTAPDEHLFDDSVLGALDAPSTILTPGYGLIGALVVAAVMLVGSVTAMVMRLGVRGLPAASSAEPPDRLDV